MGTAVRGRFNATAHYALYRAVLDPLLRQQLDAATLRRALERGRARTATEALAEHGIQRPGGPRPRATARPAAPTDGPAVAPGSPGSPASNGSTGPHRAHRAPQDVPGARGTEPAVRA